MARSTDRAIRVTGGAAGEVARAGYSRRMEKNEPAGTSRARPPSRVSGLLYGLGLGGFVDGIVLHQIFQWHHMVSHVEAYPTDTIAGLEVNTLADGFFHLVTWFLVVAASITAIIEWRRGRLAPSWSFGAATLERG